MHNLFELRLGNMTVEEYEKKFLGLLRYVGFIKEEKGEDTKVFKWIAIILQRQDPIWWTQNSGRDL